LCFWKTFEKLQEVSRNKIDEKKIFFECARWRRYRKKKDAIKIK